MPDDVVVDDDTLDVDVDGDGQTDDVDDEGATSDDDTDSDDSTDDAASDGKGGEAADEPDDSDDEDDDASKATAKPRSAAMQKLLGKYGGDEDKMVDAYFQQANSMSRLTEKLNEIEQRLTAKAEDPEAEAKFVASDSEVKEYAGELASLDAEIKRNENSTTGMVQEFGKLEKQIARLEGELERASVEDRQEIREKLNDAKGDMKALTRDWKDSQRELGRLNQQIRTVARSYRTAEAAAKARREGELQRESDAARAQHVTQREFLTTIQQEAAKYGLKSDSKTYQIVQQAVKERIVSTLRSMPKGTPPIDLQAAVTQLMAEYAEALELKSKFKRVSKQKQEALPKGPTSGLKGERQASTKLSPKSAEFWRQRARRISG
jgi:hypothetical protein